MRWWIAMLLALLIIVFAGLIAGGFSLSHVWGTAPVPPTLDPRVQLTITPLASPTTALRPTSEASPRETPANSSAITPTPLHASANPARTALAGVVQVRTDQGLGTGFVWKRQGDAVQILTAAHVVADGHVLAVITPDGREHPARVVRASPQADVALLETSDTTLRPLPMGDSSALEPGDLLYVVGYALGADLLGDPSVTRGVLSGRRIVDGIACLQTDAAMNPGNSGGPVLNERGEVVGVAAWGIRERAGVAIQGVNFAVTIEQAREALSLST